MISYDAGLSILDGFYRKKNRGIDIITNIIIGVIYVTWIWDC